MNAPVYPLLDEQELRRELCARLHDHPVSLRYLQSCSSTNMECMQDGRHANVVIAEHQRAGRGRRGKTWLSPATKNIYCSIGMLKTIDADYLGLISLQVGVSIIKVLKNQGYDGLSLKWPNDILLSGKKLGGILIETRVNSAREFFLVIGFGLNANLQDSIVSSLERPAISLAQAGHQDVDRQRLLPQLISAIFDAVLHLRAETTAGLIEEFTMLDSYLGKQVSVLEADGFLSGIYQGVDTTGHIRIKTDDGIKTFAAAEVSLRDPEHVAD